MVTFYKRVSDSVWTSISGGCGCSSGGGVTSFNSQPGTSIYNKSATKFAMTVNGRHYEFLPLKVALGVRLADVPEVLQNANLEVYDLDFLSHKSGVLGYVA